MTAAATRLCGRWSKHGGRPVSLRTPTHADGRCWTRVLASAVVLLALSACDVVSWHHARCRQEADAAVRAVSALERRRECNSVEQCAAVEKERVEVNEMRRDAQLFACMRLEGFVFDAERWALDPPEQRERSAYRYWSRAP